MVIVFVVLRSTSFFERILGTRRPSSLKKVFGIILLSIAIKLFLYQYRYSTRECQVI